MGVGGIHTDFPQRHIVGNLMDFDVTSYYPSLIKQINRSPLGLTNEWIKQFVDPYTKRVQFKQNGDKLSADVMKIVINSVYGQLNYPNSDSFDPRIQLVSATLPIGKRVSCGSIVAFLTDQSKRSTDELHATYPGTTIPD